MRKISFFFGFILIVILCFFAASTPVEAAALTNISDTITTSRPSAASPLSANAASSAKEFGIFNNNSRFLASDSARILRTSTGATVVGAFTLASQSADLQTIYLPLDGTGLASSAQGGTDVLVNAITAMHTISFKTATDIGASGKLIINFPGSFLGIASPSATTFSFNGLTSANAAANISYKLDGTRTCTTWTVSTSGTPSIQCNMDAGGTLARGTTVTFLVGCSDSSSNETACTTQAPILINPTKTASAGSADNWKINVVTTESGGSADDLGKAAIGTIESIQVSASVDPTLTFTIAPVSGAVNVGNTTGCTNSEAQSGGSATATTVNMGTLNQSGINIVAQLLTVSTNAFNGYSLTATSSGHLINPASGYALADDPTLPGTALTSGTTQFGIHACGLDVNTTNWGTAASTTGGGTGALYAWPTQTSPLTLASRALGPIGNTVLTGSGITTVEYAGTVDPTVVAGDYRTAITYVATATF